VVIPVYNERDSLGLLHENTTAVLAGLGCGYEIIFVDDGSTDGSVEVLQDLHARDSHVKVVMFRRNFGKSAALTAGFSEVQGEIVVTMDADLQDDPQEIPRFLEKLDEGYDLVTGWKHPRLDPLNKTAPSKLFNYVVARSEKIQIHDFNCGFKVMRREVVEELSIYGELHRYIPVLANWDGFRVGEIKVKHHPRKFGRSKYGVKRFTRGMFDFLTVRFLTRYSWRPLHFFGLFGLLALLTGLVVSGYLSTLWFTGERIGHRPLLLLGTLLVIIGVQFLSFGLLAEMTTSKANAGRKLYVIKKTLKRSE
jgi:glycosyltransferase involved in cell wall biosynthesis